MTMTYKLGPDLMGGGKNNTSVRHGGARKNAGRKATGRKRAQVTVSFDLDTMAMVTGAATFDNLSKSKWLEKQIVELFESKRRTFSDASISLVPDNNP